jgi:hypothetical protein
VKFETKVAVAEYNPGMDSSSEGDDLIPSKADKTDGCMNISTNRYKKRVRKSKDIEVFDFGFPYELA